MRNDSYALKADLNGEDNQKQLYTEKEANCLDNCVYKVFSSEKIMRAYLPTRLAELKLTESELQKRINNPNKDIGPYFYQKEYENKKAEEAAAAAQQSK